MPLPRRFRLSPMTTARETLERHGTQASCKRELYASRQVKWTLSPRNRAVHKARGPDGMTSGPEVVGTRRASTAERNSMTDMQITAASITSGIGQWAGPDGDGSRMPFRSSDLEHPCPDDESGDIGSLHGSDHSSEDNWRAAFRRLEGAYAPITIEGYSGDIEIFVAWCAGKGLRALPATATTIADFLQDEAGRVLPRTIRRRLCSIRKIHRMLRLPDPTLDEDVQLALRRILRATPMRPRQAKGMTRACLDLCIAAQPNTNWGLRNRALLALGYDLLARRSELSALRTEDIEFTEEGTLRVVIRRSKSDPYGMGRIGFTSRATAELVCDWLAWRGPDIVPLFCGIKQGNGCSGRAVNRFIGATTVKSIIKQAVAEAGFPPEEVALFSGHSLRVGAAQDLLRAGHDSAAIMRAGGWRSLNILGRYLEKAEHNVWS